MLWYCMVFGVTVATIYGAALILMV